jgi:hypothetical protein
VTTRSGVSRERESTLSLATRVEEVVVVQDPQRIQPFLLGERTLLPVHPPKVHAFILVGVMQELEIGFEELLASRFERNGLGLANGAEWLADSVRTTPVDESRLSALHISS